MMMLGGTWWGTSRWLLVLAVWCWLPSWGAWAATVKPAPQSAYVLADSIGYGLALDGLEAKLQERLGGAARINYDAGRSITTPGKQSKQSALQAVEADRDFIAKAGVIVIVLGMNQIEASFEASQRALMQRLYELAPKARYFWVDIGATIAPQVPGWNQRNKVIYDQASVLGYRVISRYKAIFGPTADPLAIVPGQNFPGWNTEEGYGGPGNVHGFDSALSSAILQAVGSEQWCGRKQPLSVYVLGDSIAYGLNSVRLQASLGRRLGGSVKISYDVGRSITAPGLQIKKTALESVTLDRDFIADADIIIIALGTNQSEISFADSQRELMQRLKAIAPNASYFWVDIGATIASQAAGWSARNRIIYGQANSLGYRVISRYKAIFGDDADPLHIVAGRNFPGQGNEPGFDGPGNVHGKSQELAQAIMKAMPGADCEAVK